MHSTANNLWSYLAFQRMATAQAIILAMKDVRPANSTTNQPATKGGLPCSRL